MAKLSVDQALLKAQSHAQKGDIEEAQKLYQAVLQAFPKNKRAQKGLAALNKPEQPAATQGLPQDAINQLINLYNQGQLAAVVEQAQALIGQYPEAFIIWNILGAANKGLGRVQAASEAFKKVTELNLAYADGFNNLGVTLQEQGKLDEAIASYNKALSLKPDYAEAYCNMGNALKEQSKLDEAIASYKRALSLKPDYLEAVNSMGNALKDQGKLDEAIAFYNNALSLKPDYAEAYNNIGNALKDQSKPEEAIHAYRKALAIKPNDADIYNNMGIALKNQSKPEEAIQAYHKALAIKPNDADIHNNMGNALQDQGKLEEAAQAYDKALTIKPDNAQAYNNASELLKIYSPKTTKNHMLFIIDRKIKEVSNKLILSKTNDEIVDILLQVLSYIKEDRFCYKTPFSQVYKRDSTDLNCKRHREIFNTRNIIPEFCFSCFKVQVEVDTFLELIRLTSLFYSLELEENLTTKTIIELRPDIPGLYKGLVFCKGIEQARRVKTLLDGHLKVKFQNETVSQIRRGCSEFPLKFPDYGKIENDINVKMEYPITWKKTELQFDQKNCIKPKENILKSMSGFCLSDFYVIQKWIDYARGLRDPSSEIFNDKPIIFPEIYDVASLRREHFSPHFKDYKI